MWDTSLGQASLHKRLGDRWGLACYSAHQAPPRLLLTLPFILGKLGKLMVPAPSCADHLFKPLQGMKLQIFSRREFVACFAISSWPEWDAVSRKLPPVLHTIPVVLPNFFISADAIGLTTTSMCTSQVSHQLCMLQTLFSILVSYVSIAHLHAMPNLHQVDFTPYWCASCRSSSLTARFFLSSFQLRHGSE